jgi:replicative DNA helicase
LLGAALIEPMVVSNLSAMVEPEDFYITKHGDIWSAMLDLVRKREPVDIITVSEELKDHPSVDPALLADLLNAAPTYAHAETYAKRIVNASRRRQLIRSGAEISITGYETLDSADAENEAKQILLRALGERGNTKRIMTPEQQAHLIVDMFERRAQGLSPALPTGYHSLDTALNGGLRTGQLIIIAARTSVGKSSYAENIAENIAKNSKSVLYFNLEMSDERMVERFAKRQYKMSVSAFITGPIHEKDIAAMHEIAEMRAHMPLTLINDSVASTSSIWADVNQHIMRYGPIDLVVVDYLQLLSDKQGRSGSEVLRIAQITRTLKAMAGENNVPVILISQLNRNVEHRGGEPELHDLRDSGAIEQDADVVLLMWDDDEEDKKHLKVAKNRDGPTPELPIWFDGQFFTFTEPESGSHIVID